MKGDYDQALAYLDKALPIYIQALGETHTKVAVLYNTYGKAWYGKKEYDRALDFYQKTKDILQLRMPPGHQYITMASTSLSNSANAKGTSLLEQKKYQEALPCFQKALENAEFAENWPLSFTCRSNIGRTLECLKQYADGYAVLESGVSKAREIDRASGKTDNALAICKMRFYEIGCLMGLGKKAEADTLSREVQKEASEAGAGELLEEMRKAGYLKK